jgi:putative phosphoribosyl transferase
MKQTSLAIQNRRGLHLSATLLAPETVRRPPVVVFAHGWGSSQASPRNREIAEALVEEGLAALLFDFTGHGESEGSADEAGLEAQVDDLEDVIELAAARRDLGPLGVAGSSSGGVAALAVSARDDRVRAVVLRAPSGDTSFADARRTHAPTLVIQGGADSLLPRNRELVEQLSGEHALRVVAGASHLFDEPGTFAEARRETVRWFQRWLSAPVLGGEARPRSEAVRSEDLPTHFSDRTDAGRALADLLVRHRGTNTLVLALPRGGIAVAEPIAQALGAELDVFVSRKVRAPSQPELAIGAVAEGDVVVWNDEVLHMLGVDDADRQRELDRSRKELAERTRQYRAVRPRAKLDGRAAVIVVDDGVATGATLKAAIVALGKLGVTPLVVALPGGSAETLDEIARMPEVSRVAALARPEPFFAVGQLYDEFEPVSSAEVCAALKRFLPQRGGTQRSK